MKKLLIIKSTKKALVNLFTILILLTPVVSWAHCDSYDGPVIQDALKALKTNEVRPVLKWIDAVHEEEIKDLFYKTVDLKSDKKVYELVEKHFLETLVRLHREGEGAPYTGLKPAGTVKPIVVLADHSIENESAEDLSEKLITHLQKVVNEKYSVVMEKKHHKDEDALKGRDYVEAYVEYVHFLEAIHDVIEHGSISHDH